MKISALFFWMALFTLVSVSALGDSGFDPSISGGIDGSGKHGKIGKKFQSKGDKKTNTIHGTCILIETMGNISSPCVNITLVLNDENRNEVARVRTETGGVFEFAAESSHSYTLQPESKSYTLLSPTGKISAGSRGVEVKLKL